MICHSCQKEIQIEDKVSFRAECPNCDADLHVCLNCKFYDPSVYNECHETQADRVVEKDRANYCEYFVTAEKSEGKPVDPSEDVKRKLEEMFKK